MNPKTNTSANGTEKPVEGSVIDKAEKEFQEDPFQKRILADMGLLLGKDGTVQKVGQSGQPEQPKQEKSEERPNFTFTTFGEAVRDKEDAKKREEEQAKVSKEEEEKKIATEAKANEHPKEEKAEEPQKKKVDVKAPERSLEEVVNETVTKAIQAREPKPEPKAASTPAPKNEEQKDEFESSLTTAERRELDLWKFAARKEPEKYKDAPKQWLEFYKKVDAYVRKATQDNPDRALDESDDEFTKFVRDNRPKVSQTEREELRETMIEDRVASRVKSDYQKQLEDRDRRLREVETRPVIEQTLQKFESHAISRMAGLKDTTIAEVASKISELGPEKARQEFRLEAPIVEQELKRARGMANEYMLLKAGLKAVNMEDSAHADLVNFIVRQGDVFAAEGGDARVRTTQSGQRVIFLPNHKYNELAATNPSQLSSHWTFSDADILDLLAIDATAKAQKAIAAKEKELEEAGYTRQKKGKAPKQENKAPEPKPTDNPKITTAPSPGAASGAAAVAAGMMSGSELKSLGLAR